MPIAYLITNLVLLFALGNTTVSVFEPYGYELFTRVPCLLYTSDAADDLLCVDLGGRRIIKKKKYYKHLRAPYNNTKCRLNRRTYTTTAET